MASPVMLMAQETQTSNISVGVHPSDSLQGDARRIIEDAPLDIARNRGIFIVTPDQKMQMRIIGSVRMLVVLDNHDISNKNALDTYVIPTGDDNQRFPNYFNGLD